MNKNYVLLFVMVFVLLSGCASVPTKDIQVDAQADPKANFSGYRTYAWLGQLQSSMTHTANGSHRSSMRMRK